MLVAHPENRDVWQAYAVACYMNKDFANCLSTIDSILKFIQEQADSKKKTWDLTPVQKFEVIKMKIKAHEELGEIDKALDYLQANVNEFVDDLQRSDFLGRLYSKKGDSEKAIHHFEDLLMLNACNFDTYYSLIEAKGVKLRNEHGEFVKDLSDKDRETVTSTLAYYQ